MWNWEEQGAGIEDSVSSGQCTAVKSKNRQTSEQKTGDKPVLPLCLWQTVNLYYWFLSDILYWVYHFGNFTMWVQKKALTCLLLFLQKYSSEKYMVQFYVRFLIDLMHILIHCKTVCLSWSVHFSLLANIWEPEKKVNLIPDLKVVW